MIESSNLKLLQVAFTEGTAPSRPLFCPESVPFSGRQPTRAKRGIFRSCGKRRIRSRIRKGRRRRTKAAGDEEQQPQAVAGCGCVEPLLAGRRAPPCESAPQATTPGSPQEVEQGPLPTHPHRIDLKASPKLCKTKQNGP